MNADRIRLSVGQSRLSYRAMFDWAPSVIFISSLVISPLFEMAFFVYLGRYVHSRQPAGFYVVGVAIIAAARPGIYGGVMSLTGERRSGSISYLFISARSRLVVVIERAMAYVPACIAVGLSTFVIGALLWGPHLNAIRTLGFAMPLLFASCSASAFGAFLGAVGLRARNVYLMANLGDFAILLLSGNVAARSSMPAIARWIGEVAPTGHAGGVARGILLESGDVGVAVALGAELALAVLFLGGAALALTRAEVQARRDGSFDFL